MNRSLVVRASTRWVCLSVKIALPPENGDHGPGKKMGITAPASLPRSATAECDHAFSKRSLGGRCREKHGQAGREMRELEVPAIGRTRWSTRGGKINLGLSVRRPVI